MNTVRKEVKQRRARLINQQDHIAFLKCKGCPKREPMILPRNAGDARFIGNYVASEKSWSRLVICVGGRSEELKENMQ